MHDLRYLRENLDAVRDRLGSRGADVPWDELNKLLQERRTVTVTVDDLRYQLKIGSNEVARLKREKQPADEAMAAMKAVGNRISDMEDQTRILEERLSELALRIPNLPHESVPIGGGSADNVEVRRWGDAPTMSFVPKPHWELGEALGILDFDDGPRRAARARAHQLYA
jgi:seryl-tRNA synthetase